MVKHRRRKIEAKQRQARTGESYQAALNAVSGRPDFRLAMIRARQAAVAGDIKSVERFARKWVRLPSTPRWLDAVTSALVHEAVESLNEPEQFLQLVRSEHRQMTPVWQRQTRHGRVLPLDTELGDGLSLYDLVPASTDTPEGAADEAFEDRRLETILHRLEPVERQVVLAYAEADGTTWTEAAAAIGASEPASFGERVRRKVRRLAAELKRRAAQVGREVTESDPGQGRGATLPRSFSGPQVSADRPESNGDQA
jgi:DNA-directed RNA polymerase specialized sigma24 family protein